MILIENTFLMISIDINSNNILDVTLSKVFNVIPVCDVGCVYVMMYVLATAFKHFFESVEFKLLL